MYIVAFGVCGDFERLFMLVLCEACEGVSHASRSVQGLTCYAAESISLQYIFSIILRRLTPFYCPGLSSITAAPHSVSQSKSSSLLTHEP